MAKSPDSPSSYSSRPLPRIDEGVFHGSKKVTADIDDNTWRALGLEQGPLLRAIVIEANLARQEGLDPFLAFLRGVGLVINSQSAQLKRLKDFETLQAMFGDSKQIETEHDDVVDIKTSEAA